MKGKRTHFNPYAAKMNTTTAVIFTIYLQYWIYIGTWMTTLMVNDALDKRVLLQ